MKKPVALLVVVVLSSCGDVSPRADRAADASRDARGAEVDLAAADGRVDGAATREAGALDARVADSGPKPDLAPPPCTHYVSPSGTLRGHPAATTIGAAVKGLAPGDTLCIGAGTYVEQVSVTVSGTASKPITLLADPGAKPVLDGQDKLAGSWGSLLNLKGSYLRVLGPLEVKRGLGQGVALGGHHNLVRELDVHHHAERGIGAQGDYSVVEKCRVWWNASLNCRLASCPPTPYPSGGWGTGVSAMRDSVDGITDHAVLRGNIVYNNWGEGLSSFEAQGTLIEDNVVYDNWALNIYISDSSNVLCQRNVVYTTPGNAVQKQAGGLTLADERADKPRSAHNTVINNLFLAAGISAFSWTLVSGSGLDDVLIAHNTILNGSLSTGSTPNKSSRVVGNIVFRDDGGSLGGVPSKTGLTFSNNLWSKAPAANASGAGDVIGDPLLARSGPTGAGQLTAGYFKLQPGSPAEGKGKALTEVTEDFFRAARPAAPDLGAHER